MLFQTRHPNEMPYLPLQVDGDVYRVVMREPYAHDAGTGSSNEEQRKS